MWWWFSRLIFWLLFSKCCHAKWRGGFQWKPSWCQQISNMEGCSMLNILVELIIVAMLCEIIHIFEYIWIHSNNLQYGRMFDFRYLARGADYRGSYFPIYFTTTWHEIPFQSIQTYHNQSSRYGLLSLQYLGRVDYYVKLSAIQQ